MEFDIKVFSGRLRELRLEKGMSTIKLGKELGFSDATISRWENGLIHPGISSLYKIAKYFNVTAGYLIGTEDN